MTELCIHRIFCVIFLMYFVIRTYVHARIYDVVFKAVEERFSINFISINFALIMKL